MFDVFLVQNTTCPECSGRATEEVCGTRAMHPRLKAQTASRDDRLKGEVIRNEWDTLARGVIGMG
jgi:hypothetical protein